MKGDLALRVAFLKALFDRLAVVDKDTREALLTDTVPGERVPAVLPSGDVAGWVTRTKPAKTKAAPKVTDSDAFRQWVQANRPDEVVQPPPPAAEVRSSYTAAVLKAVQEDGGIVEPSTGEVTVPPGVEWVTPDPAKSNLRVVLEEDGADLIAQAWADGTLSLDTLTALPASTQ